MAEATNELAFLATGAYGHPMAKQHGAPLRLAVPWKYGFKSIKSIVRFSFIDKRPKGMWEALQAAEYGFWANVNPEVPHPRWSQATEEVIGTGERRADPAVQRLWRIRRRTCTRAWKASDCGREPLPPRLRRMLIWQQGRNRSSGGFLAQSRRRHCRPLSSSSAPLPAHAAEEPDLIFKRSTVFKWLTPNDKLATYGLDDPEVEGVACHFTVPERGGFKGWIGVAEEVSDISLACRQIGPIKFKAKFEQGEDVFRQRRSLFFKKMQIVRGCDVKRNVLVYMVYSDRIIEGSPKNSTSSGADHAVGRQRRGRRNARTGSSRTGRNSHCADQSLLMSAPISWLASRTPATTPPMPPKRTPARKMSTSIVRWPVRFAAPGDAAKGQARD